MEWSSEYNPFNSMGCLIHSKHLNAIANQDFLPPIMVDIDPSNVCNLNCFWCNSMEVRIKSKDLMSKEHLFRIADFIMDWGVISACVAGGGEPMINVAFCDLLYRLYRNNIKIGVISNGTLMGEKEIESIADTCRWCGISVDAGIYSTYNKCKNANENTFSDVIRNIEYLVKKVKTTDSNCSVGFKYLLCPENASEIYYACRLAKSLGVSDFHLRPVGHENIYAFRNRKLTYSKYTIELINDEIDRIRELESDDFRVYTIKHKFTPDFKRKTDFSRCWALPLLITFGADGNYHTCFDMRGREDLIIGKHYPNPENILEFWNTDNHKRLLETIDVTECPRCTFSSYNKIIEEVFIDDKMCRDFI